MYNINLKTILLDVSDIAFQNERLQGANAKNVTEAPASDIAHCTKALSENFVLHLILTLYEVFLVLSLCRNHQQSFCCLQSELSLTYDNIVVFFATGRSYIWGIFVFYEIVNHF